MQRTQTSLDFEAYWRTLCGDRPMPDVTDFDPLAIPALVPNLFELYVEPGAEVPSQIRFAGGDIVSAANVEVTDTDYFSYFADNLKGATMNRLEWICSLPSALCQLNPLNLGKGSPITVELTGFPFSSPDFEIAVFGTVVVAEDSKPTGKGRRPHLQKATDRTWIDLGFGVPDDPDA